MEDGRWKVSGQGSNIEIPSCRGGQRDRLVVFRLDLYPSPKKKQSITPTSFCSNPQHQRADSVSVDTKGELNGWLPMSEWFRCDLMLSTGMHEVVVLD